MISAPATVSLAPLLAVLLLGPLLHGPRLHGALLHGPVAPPASSPELAGAATPAPRSTPAAAKVYLTVEEALELAFGKCDVTRGTHYLTEAQLERARTLAEVDVPAGIVHPYEARRGGELVGTAWFDTHRVRTHRETLMVVVDPARRVQRLELLAFAEPEEYVPRGNWYGQFLGKPLSDELNLKRGIRGVTGATLTARATTEAVRRVLALHEVLCPPPPEPDGDGDGDDDEAGREGGSGKGADRPSGAEGARR